MFAFAVVNLTAQNCCVFSVRVPVRTCLLIWWEFKAQDDCSGFGRIAEQNRRLSPSYEGNIEPFQLIFVNRV